MAQRWNGPPEECLETISLFQLLDSTLFISKTLVLHLQSKRVVPGDPIMFSDYYFIKFKWHK